MKDFRVNTNVRINLEGMPEAIAKAKDNFDAINDPDRKTPLGRSLFCQWNTVSKFYERLVELPKDKTSEKYPNSVIIQVEGSAKGGTSRVYFKPSVTSLPKYFRNFIVPLDDTKVFAYADLKAAEFAYQCFACQETAAISEYLKGNDIYMYYAHIFPKNTPRAVIKKILIANMYNQTAYSVQKDLGISENEANFLLSLVAKNLPKMTTKKIYIEKYCRQYQGYYAPNGFNFREMIKVASINAQKGFNVDYSLSAFTQSGLGFLMQQFTSVMRPKVLGTYLTVFDSVLAEIKEFDLERFQSTIDKLVKPLLFDRVTLGKTFFEAYNK